MKLFQLTFKSYQIESNLKYYNNNKFEIRITRNRIRSRKATGNGSDTRRPPAESRRTAATSLYAPTS